jgi:hypothetical protein
MTGWTVHRFFGTAERVIGLETTVAVGFASIFGQWPVDLNPGEQQEFRGFGTGVCVGFQS